MSILSNYIIQDLIQNVSKGVTETFKFVLERYNSNEVFAYTLYIDDYCSYLGWAANTISHYEIEKVNYPKEDQPFIKWYYPQFAIGLGEVPEKIDSVFNNEIQNILNDANTLISEDNFEQYQAEVYDSIIEGFKKAIENIDKKKTNNVIFFVSIVEVLVVVFCFDSLGPHPTKPDKSTAAHKPDNSFLFIISPPNIL